MVVEMSACPSSICTARRSAPWLSKWVAKAIKAARVVAFADLGMEAIYEFEVKDMPVTVAVDSHGTSVHQTGPADWRARIAAARAKQPA